MAATQASSSAFQLDDFLTLDHCAEALSLEHRIVLDAETRHKVLYCRQYLDKVLTDQPDRAIYGINTGFGSLCKVSIPSQDLEQLQENLLMSHAAGMGGKAPSAVVRLMLLQKIKALSLGHSGIRVEVLERLMLLYHEGVVPVIHEMGSLGASGDLVPLAEMCLPLLGMGDVFLSKEGRYLSAKVWHTERGLAPLRLASKEGLALLNGTQYMSAYGTWTLLQARHLMGWAITIAALSFEAWEGRVDAFHPAIHQVRRHEGQKEVATLLRALLTDSPIRQNPNTQVQDPYSFRCTPQVLGASLTSLRQVASIFTEEINAVTDNPLIFPEEDLIVSGGNFHGQPLALALDQMAIALAEIGNISERRLYQMMHGFRGLPEFLVESNGLNSGMMIPQYAVASLVSQNKQYCTPASIDSIPSCNGQEDHVSMGANAAIKAQKVCENLRAILAVELLAANQALHLRGSQTSPKLQATLDTFRQYLPAPHLGNDGDQIMHHFLTASQQFLESESSPLDIVL